MRFISAQIFPADREFPSASQHMAMIGLSSVLLQNKAACVVYLHNRPSPSRSDSHFHEGRTANLRTIIVIADIHRGIHSPALHIAMKDPPCLTFRHWSGVTPYTSSYEFAGSCVFGKQLPGKLSLRPHLLTEKGQALSLTYGRFFAEFLEDILLVRLGLLDLTTCVGLRYGRL